MDQRRYALGSVGAGAVLTIAILALHPMMFGGNPLG